MNIKGTGALKDCIMEFNGHDHKLDVVIAKADTANTFEVDIDTIDGKSTMEVRAEWHEIDGLEPAVIKHNGKHQILLGRDRIFVAMGAGKKTVKARVVTSVALKDARVAEVQARTAPSAPPFNPPRFVNQERRNNEQRPFTPRANAGPSHERTRTFDHVVDRNSRPQHTTVNRSPNKPAYPKRKVG